MFFNRRKQQAGKVILQGSPPLAKRPPEKPRRFLRVVFYFLFLAFLGIAVYLFFFSSFLEIQLARVSGLEELSPQNVLDKVESDYAGRYFSILSRNNILLISKNKIETNLKESFPKIRSVQVQKIFPGTLMVNIEERKSLLLWCSGGPCYIIDENGYAYTGIDLDDPRARENNLIKVIDTSARPVKIGEKLLTEDYVLYLLALREELKEINKNDISASEEWETPSLVAEEVEMATSQGWHLYFSAKVSPAKARRTFLAFWEEELDSEKREKLEYVDLRVENKVYYKLREDEAAQSDIEKEEKEKPEKKD